MTYRKISPMLAASGCLLAISGCASVPGTVDINDITLHPGDSSTCLYSPCTVYFVMPPGDGKFVLKENGPGGTWVTGEFNAGTKANLGEYWAGFTIFTLEGVEGSKTWLFVDARD